MWTSVGPCISAVLFDILQQQQHDPVPLAALVLHTFRGGALALEDYPALASLVAFADVIVAGQALGSCWGKQPGKVGRCRLTLSNPR